MEKFTKHFPPEKNNHTQNTKHTQLLTDSSCPCWGGNSKRWNSTNGMNEGTSLVPPLFKGHYFQKGKDWELGSIFFSGEFGSFVGWVGVHVLLQKHVPPQQNCCLKLKFNKKKQDPHHFFVKKNMFQVVLFGTRCSISGDVYRWPPPWKLW